MTALEVSYDTYDADSRAVDQEKRGSQARLGVPYER